MRRGFTLIELLVVIAVIAVLAAILFPVFAQAKRAAKTTTALANERQLGIGFALYAGDNGDVLPPSTEGIDGEGRTGGWIFYSQFGVDEAGRFDPAQGALYPYVKSPGVYVSPLDDDAREAKDSFAFNGCLIDGTFHYGINPSVATTAVANPSGTMLLGEEASDGANGHRGTNDGFFHPQFDHFALRNAGGAALVFVDGHVKVQKDRLQQAIDGGDKPCWP